GNIELDSNAAIGANAGSLNISGQISDNSTGHDLTINGSGATTGQIIFSHVGGNTYRGQTAIDNGILTITDAQALGQAGPSLGDTTNGTVVNSSPTGSGTLQLDGGGSHFTVLNELLTLNGPGFNGMGALDNVRGDNEWAGNVILGSPSPN